MSDDVPKQRRRLSLTVLAAVLALATGGVSLLLTLRPELAPDPRTRIGATITIAAIDHGVDREDFYEAWEPEDDDRREQLERDYLEPRFDRKLTKRELDDARTTVLREERGSIVYVDVQGLGLKDREVRLSWWRYDAGTGRRDGVGTTSFEAEGGAPDDRFIIPAFIDAPENCKRVFVRFELRDDKGTLLTIATTKQFVSLPCSSS